VDDSPVNLGKAVEAGILGTGLLAPWNEDSGYPLFKTLIEVLGYLDSRLNSGRGLPKGEDLRGKACFAGDGDGPKK
jgi:hypothetical protein